MKVNSNFANYEIGDLIEVSSEEQDGATLVKVYRKWYPKEGSVFTETEEAKTLGYLMSKKDGIFPQLLCKVINTKNKSQLKGDIRETHILLEGNEFNKIVK